MSTAISDPDAQSLRRRYLEALGRHGQSADPAQLDAVGKLQQLADRLATKHRPFGFWQRQRIRLFRDSRISPVRGLYIWGSVGRGKTFLMDLFYEHIRSARKHRSHFHRFMQDVHTTLKSIANREAPLEIVAQRLAERARLICFDEFYVSDIADAMILGNLFSGLFRRGVTLVATSNIPPTELYRDGLQRERFLSVIDMLETHTEVLKLAGTADYRLRALERAEIYHHPLDPIADRNLERYFRDIAPEEGQCDAGIEVLGRTILTRRCADAVMWCDFDQICDGPRSQADYIEIARCYQTVIVSGVPLLDAGKEEQARRFVALVDEFYDRNVKLIMSVAVPLSELYTGKRLRAEFTRTRSRLIEMQSHEYLARPHIP